MLFLKQPFILPFVSHKSSAEQGPKSQVETCPIQFCQSGIIGITAFPQQPHKQGSSFWDTVWDRIIHILSASGLEQDKKTYVIENFNTFSFGILFIYFKLHHSDQLNSNSPRRPITTLLPLV